MLTPDDPAAALTFEAEEGVSTWSWDVASGVVSWSAGIDAIFGLPPGGFGGSYEAYLALVHPDDRAHFQALITRTLQSEDEYVMSHRVLWPDGSTHWIDGRGRLTRDAEGRPVRLYGVSWDSRARKSAEASIVHLRRVQAVAGAVSRELLRVRTEQDVFEQACRIAVDPGHFRFAWVGLVVEGESHLVPVARAGIDAGYLDEVDRERIAEDASPASRSVRTGERCVVSDIAREPALAPIREAARRRGYQACASFPLRRGGRVIGAFAIYAGEEGRFDAPQLDLLGTLADDIGFTLDAIEASERRRTAEEAMRRSEEQFRALFEQAADAIFIAEGDGTIVDGNRAACAMTGHGHDELCARAVGDLLTNPTPFPVQKAVEERQLRRKDGTLIDVEVSVSALAGGRVQAHVRDVTLRNRVQQQLILSDRLASLGLLAAGIAHEVNNPLAYLSLGLQRVERALARLQADSSPVLADVRAATADARDGAERVRGVVRALGAFGRDDGASVGVVDVHRVLDTAVRLAENRVRHRGTIVKDYRAARSVRGNELRLSQVFVNLLVNAADAQRDDAAETNEIHLRTIDDGDSVLIEVRDNGTGIPADILSRIFDPFFTTKGVGKGTGLGLAISHSIVSSYGGTISVESRVGGGSAFRVTLLAGEETVDQPAIGPQADVETRCARILVVDDEPLLARTVAALLSPNDVEIETTARAALERCELGDYDVILCDLMMPGMNGMDFHGELTRKRPELAHSVVFMTGGAFTPRAREFVAALPIPVLEKPFSEQQLHQAVRGVLASARRNRAPSSDEP